MSEFFFGLGPGHLDHEIVDPVAKEHESTLVNYTEPNGHKRHWFATRNRGAPFDRQTASACMAALEATPGALTPVPDDPDDE